MTSTPRAVASEMVRQLKGPLPDQPELGASSVAPTLVAPEMRQPRLLIPAIATAAFLIGGTAGSFFRRRHRRTRPRGQDGTAAYQDWKGKQ